MCLCVGGLLDASDRGYETEAPTGTERRAQRISVQERGHWKGEWSVDKTKILPSVSTSPSISKHTIDNHRDLTVIVH